MQYDNICTLCKLLMLEYFSVYYCTLLHNSDISPERSICWNSNQEGIHVVLQAGVERSALPPPFIRFNTIWTSSQPQYLRAL